MVKPARLFSSPPLRTHAIVVSSLTPTVAAKQQGQHPLRRSLDRKGSTRGFYFRSHRAEQRKASRVLGIKGEHRERVGPGIDGEKVLSQRVGNTLPQPNLPVDLCLHSQRREPSLA